MHTTSASLLQRIRETGQDQDWTRFVELYAPLLMQWAEHLGLEETEAMDLVQEVMLHLLEKLPDFDYNPQKRFRGWLWTVLVNTQRQRWRRLKSTPRHEPLPLDELREDTVPGLEELEYQQYVATRALQLMRRDFPESTWRACWLCIVDGKSTQEVASELGMAPATVRGCKLRVLGHLRRELEGLIF